LAIFKPVLTATTASTAAEDLRSLQLVGEFANNLEKIMRKAYNTLFSKVNVEKAFPKDGAK